ncbi:alpha-1,2-fucosyltransferase [Candidatus Beckwithbacteria bacterium]|nr:alpha-1,2-fucosyltransferase [Candidatus Beckwithbacteria bacterium]
MIITKLTGGLGNQMFQYAAGKALAERLQSPFKLDIEQYSLSLPDTARQYELEAFELNAEFATSTDLLLFKMLSKLSSKYNYFKDKNNDFNKDFLKLKNHVFLIGHWQSYKYFEHIAAKLRSDFTLKKELENQLFKKTKRKIENNQSVSIHVRRTDYLTYGVAFHTHGLCGMDYYQKAIRKIIKKVKKPYFFIFSDDLAWCKKNFQLPFPTEFVQGQNPAQDMSLMSYCKHNIIANSTFSWWAAWLNIYQNKQVIAPKQWFKTLQYNVSDRFPNNWTLI